MNSDGLPTGSFFESLEPRLLLSGTISTALVGGNLTILGDAASNQIAIVRDGNTITITGNDGETFAGAGAVINNVLGNIRIVMGGGDDQVTIGEAANKFWVGCEIPRDLIIDLGGGDDVLTLIAVQARNCTVIGGAGLNQISIIDNAGSDWIEDASQFFGNLTVTNGNDGGDILIAGTIVARNATISLGNGGGTLLVTHSVRQDAGNPAPLFGSWFMGNLTIKGGAGNDVVGLIGIPGADNLRPLDIEGHLSVSLLGSQAGGENGFWLSNVTVRGNMTYIGGAGADQVLQQYDLSVYGNVLLNMGTGDNLFDTTAGQCSNWIGGNFTYTGGVGVDVLQTDATLRVQKNVTINLGGGNNQVFLTANAPEDSYLHVGGNLLITSNGGHDTVIFGGEDQLAFGAGAGGFIGGNATFKLGDGNNVLWVSEGPQGLRILGNLSYVGGTGGDAVVVIGGLVVGRNATFALSGGHNVLRIDSESDVSDFIFVGGNLLVTANGGNDQVEMGGGTGGEICGNATFNLGAGNNTLEMDIAEGLIVVGNLAYNGGAGDDALRFLNGELRVDGSVTLTLGAGNNSANFENTDEEVLSVGGNLAYTGGAGADVLLFDGRTQVRGNAVIKALNGDNSMTAAGGFNVEGKFGYDGGTGADILDLRSLYVLGDTGIKTGDGADAIAIYHNSFLKRTSVDAGNGNDRVFLGDNAAQTGGWGLTMLKGPTQVLMGGGDDSLTVGYAGGGGLSALAIDLLKFDGGTNATAAGDTLTILNALSVIPPLLPNWETFVD